MVYFFVSTSDKILNVICKKLLQGEKVRIPGLDEDFCVWEVFYDLYTGEKINRNSSQDD